MIENGFMSWFTSLRREVYVRIFIIEGRREESQGAMSEGGAGIVE